MANPTSSPKPFCFVLMPFDSSFDDIYQLGIKDACKKAGAYCERVDEQIFQETILDRIYNQIAKADVIVADMTGRNANVFYEVGYAHALGKTTILLTQEADDIPFDLKHFPHIVYGAKITALKDDLHQRLKWFLSQPRDGQESASIEVELYLEDKNLSAGSVVQEYGRGHIPWADITVRNGSAETFEPGAFKIGVITGSKFNRCRHGHNKYFKTTKLPDGGYLHMLPELTTLFPESYDSVSMGFEWTGAGNDDTEPEVGTKDDVTLRVFTSI